MRCALVLACAGMMAMTNTVTAAEPFGTAPMWLPNAQAAEADVHAAFRGVFTLDADAEVEIRLLGASWFVLWLDGAYLVEGPARFPVQYPEYQTVRVTLAKGAHALAAQVHHEGVSTRILDNVPPFLLCAVRRDGRELPVDWKCARLGGYAEKLLRVNPQFGWVEWCDTRQIPANWRDAGFDDAGWETPGPARVELGEIKPLSAAEVRQFPHALTPADGGMLAEVFGYDRDNPAARFFLRDLECADLPPQGVWRRYDLGRVRLGRPRLMLDLPEGAVVEFAYSESLSHGRVAPWITLSAGDSCNLEHFVARGGAQEFFPLTPKGGRFLEVHVIAPPDSVKFLEVAYLERCYYGAPEGAFESGDALLDRIWSVGIETHRACAEDALTDNPTRERGQWAGDVVSVGMDIAAAGYADLRLCRRGLVQCAQSARPDGMVAGLCPGGAAFLSTYAAQWVSACVHYWELTGDRSLLEEMLPFAERNLAAFRAFFGPEGLRDEAGWGFVDWGYVRNDGPVDMGVNLHYHAALLDMVRWCGALGRKDLAEKYSGEARETAAVLEAWFGRMREGGAVDWERVGYHRAVLGLRLGFFRGGEEAEAVAFIKRHMLDCFPNNPGAPRLSDPGNAQPRLITPYFAHYAMPELAARGEADFVLDQFRTCWGWMLEGDRSTWIEVFDTRWSHSHQWAGCPTWQLSRHVLGLEPRQDLGPGHFVWTLNPGGITRASGRVPLPGDAEGRAVSVAWDIPAGDVLSYTVDAPVPVTLHLPGKDGPVTREITGKQTLVLRSDGAGWVVVE